MTSEQPEKYAYCENENNISVMIFFSLKAVNVSGSNSNCVSRYVYVHGWERREVVTLYMLYGTTHAAGTAPFPGYLYIDLS